MQYILWMCTSCFWQFTFITIDFIPCIEKKCFLLSHHLELDFWWHVRWNNQYLYFPQILLEQAQKSISSTLRILSKSKCGCENSCQVCLKKRNWITCIALQKGSHTCILKILMKSHLFNSITFLNPSPLSVKVFSF